MASLAGLVVLLTGRARSAPRLARRRRHIGRGLAGRTDRRLHPHGQDLFARGRAALRSAPSGRWSVHRDAESWTRCAPWRTWPRPRPIGRSPTPPTTITVKELIQLARSARSRTTTATRKTRSTVRSASTTRSAPSPRSCHSPPTPRPSPCSRTRQEGRWRHEVGPAFGGRPHGAACGMSGPRSKTTASSDGLVVAHVPLEALLDDDSTLCGDLERGGFISSDAIRRLLCDSTLIIAADDDARSHHVRRTPQRLATHTQRREIWRRDRHCRFPCCDNAIFCLPHHIDRWKPTTDRPICPI